MLGIGFALLFFASSWIIWWHLRQRREGNPGVQIHHFLIAGIIGIWLCLTVALAAAAWMWTQRGFAGSPGVIVKHDAGPLEWSASFSIEGNRASRIYSLRFLGVNVSRTKAIQLKEANIISGIDGTLLPLQIAGVNAEGESKIVPIDQVQLIPPGARVELVAKLGAPDPNTPGNVLGLEPKPFLEKWRQFSFNVSDDMRSYRNDFNDTHMMVFFQGKVGPRVTIKPDQNPVSTR